MHGDNLKCTPFTDICDDLQGKYPKDFKFTGWHPLCRCFATPILKTTEEMKADNERMLRGEEPSAHSVNEVKDVPARFKAWVKDNEDRIRAAEERGTLPYFIKDNPQSLYYKDTQSGLKISYFADKSELSDNIRTGRILLHNHKMDLAIRPHSHVKDVKNPEYELNGMLADAKRLESWNVASAFNSAIKQNCKVVIIDLHKMEKNPLRVTELSKNIVRRYDDFISGKIKECYIVYQGKSVVIKNDLLKQFEWKKREKYYQTIIAKLNRIK